MKKKRKARLEWEDKNKILRKKKENAEWGNGQKIKKEKMKKSMK